MYRPDTPPPPNFDVDKLLGRLTACLSDNDNLGTELLTSIEELQADYSERCGNGGLDQLYEYVLTIIENAAKEIREELNEARSAILRANGDD